ncbi:hypothetical protein ALC60_10896 [Trachymyrmex zeteki]|uniref:Uncharacterized protein n=1 Tax=Mycetomoellerius zeteki TaxID=64791 RepID=A0A151WQA0_9HYME|nr:hypothetical protein ALC60_10896 [Trachymyrmex zeteki]
MYKVLKISHRSDIDDMILDSFDAIKRFLKENPVLKNRHIKNSFQLVKDLSQLNLTDDSILVSLDVVSLFTNGGHRLNFLDFNKRRKQFNINGYPLDLIFKNIKKRLISKSKLFNRTKAVSSKNRQNNKIGQIPRSAGPRNPRHPCSRLNQCCSIRSLKNLPRMHENSSIDLFTLYEINVFTLKMG